MLFTSPPLLYLVTREMFSRHAVILCHWANFIIATYRFFRRQRSIVLAREHRFGARRVEAKWGVVCGTVNAQREEAERKTRNFLLDQARY